MGGALMRYIRYGFLLALAIALITVALANRGPVVLNLLPEGLTGFLGLSWSLSLPLFIVIFAAIVAGILIGFVWEWMREHRHRAEAARARRERDRLAREVSQLRGTAASDSDDVLALLE